MSKSKKLTLKMVKKAVKITMDGRQRLDLSNMGIATFPKCLLKMTNVDELDLSRNLLRKLPEFIGNLSSLRCLDLHSNKLQALPNTFGNLVRLTHLNLSNNCLTSGGLPTTLGSLTCLQSLNLGLNRLDDLPPTMAALTNLQELCLFDNVFKKLPEFVEILTSITKLNADRNPLSYTHRGGTAAQKVLASEVEETLYLATECSLCTTCLGRCKRETQTRRVRGGKVVIERKRKRSYSGLITPNSVAINTQDVWRIEWQKH